MQAPVAVRCFTNCYTLPLPLPLPFIYHMNRVNSRNGSAMVTAPQTLTFVSLLLLLLLLL